MKIAQQYKSLEVFVKELKDEMSEDQQRNKALENRVGMLEAREIESKEVIEKSIIDSKDVKDRLGSLETKVVEMIEKMEDGVLPVERQKESDPTKTSAGNLATAGATASSNIDY